MQITVNATFGGNNVSNEDDNKLDFDLIHDLLVHIHEETEKGWIKFLMFINHTQQNDISEYI